MSDRAAGARPVQAGGRRLWRGRLVAARRWCHELMGGAGRGRREHGEEKTRAETNHRERDGCGHARGSWPAPSEGAPPWATEGGCRRRYRTPRRRSPQLAKGEGDTLGQNPRRGALDTAPCARPRQKKAAAPSSLFCYGHGRACTATQADAANERAPTIDTNDNGPGCSGRGSGESGRGGQRSAALRQNDPMAHHARPGCGHGGRHDQPQGGHRRHTRTVSGCRPSQEDNQPGRLLSWCSDPHLHGFPEGESERGKLRAGDTDAEACTQRSPFPADHTFDVHGSALK